MATKLFKLSEIFEFSKKSHRKAGDGLTEGEFPFFTSSQIQSKWFNEADYNKESLILGTGGSASIHIADKFSTSTDTFIITCTNNLVSTQYVYYFLLGKKYILDAGFKGAGLKHISKVYVQKINVPIPIDSKGNPDMKEQERVVAVIKEAEDLKNKRTEANQKMDNLIPDIFSSLFGDPDKNEKHWKTQEIGKVCKTIYRYPTFYGFKYEVAGIPVVKIGNILENGIVDPEISNYTFITNEINNKFPKTILELFDILMAVRGDGSTGKRIGLVLSKSLVGANMSPNLLRFKTNESILNPIYLFHLMISNGGQSLINRRITRTSKKTITSKDIVLIEIPVPPIEMQNKFAELVKDIESQKEKQTQSTQIIDELFNAVMAKSFL